MDDQEDLLALEQGEMGNVAVLRPRLVHGDGLFFIAARQWFGPAKTQGLAMLKVARKKIDDDTAARIASDLAIVVRGVLGSADGAFIATTSEGFEAKVGEKLAALLNFVHLPVFAPEGIKLDPRQLPRERRMIFVAIETESLFAHAKALENSGVKNSLIVWVHGNTRGA